MAISRRTVLLVEDEEAITAPLSSALEREGFDVEVVDTAEQALARARALRPDMVLLDVMLPDGSGFDVCRQLRQESQVSVIMLTARGEEADRVLGLELGADDYVVKPFSAREVVARVRSVLRRVNTVADDRADSPIRVDDLVIDQATRTATKGGQALDLTRKEFDLLHLLMSQAGSVVTRDRLIDEVWDMNWFGSTKTLDVHVSGLRRKLGEDSSSPRYIHTVRGIGFRFTGPEQDR